jgi:hypothetical protein
MFKIIALLFIAFYLLSCNKTQHAEIETDLVVIDLNTLKVQNPLDRDGDGVFDSCRFVRLETTENSLIGWINKIHITDSLFFISDYNEKLFVFDSSGNFKNTIASIGSGPDEVLSLTHFLVDEKKNCVYIFDVMQSKIKSYSFEGALLSSTNIDKDNWGFYSSVQLLSNGDILLKMINHTTQVYNYKIVSKSNTSKKGVDLLKYPVVGNDFISYSQSIASENEVYVLSLNSDTIHTIVNNNAIPKFLFRGNLPVFDNYEKFGSDVYQDDGRILGRIRREGYSTGLSSLLATNDCLTFNSFEDGTQNTVFWLINENHGYVVKNHLPHNVFSSFYLITTTFKNAFVSCIPAHRAIEDQNSPNRVSDNKIDDLVSEMHEEDNPILGFYYIKN